MDRLPGDVFARRLRGERERLGVIQVELARRMSAFLGQKVDPSAITRMEQQTRAVRLDEAVAAAKSLGVPLAVLLEDDPVGRNSLELAQGLSRLEGAQKELARAHAETVRLAAVVDALVEEGRPLRQHAGSSAARGIGAALDPGLAKAIDDRVPLRRNAPYCDQE